MQCTTRWRWFCLFGARYRGHISTEYLNSLLVLFKLQNCVLTVGAGRQWTNSRSYRVLNLAVSSRGELHEKVYIQDPSLSLYQLESIVHQACI